MKYNLERLQAACNNGRFSFGKLDPELSCRDHSCRMGASNGLATNGGCRCFDKNDDDPVVRGRKKAVISEARIIITDLIMEIERLEDLVDRIIEQEAYERDHEDN